MPKPTPLRKRKNDPMLYHPATDREDALRKMKSWISEGNIIDFLLTRAVEHNDLIMAQLALESGANPNFQNRFREGPRMALCERGKLKMFQLLLKHGLSVGHDQFGEPLLIRAVYCERMDLFSVFVKAGADVNAHRTDRSLSTALHEAAETRLGPKMVRLLLDLGADPREVNAVGENALDSAKYRQELFGDVKPAVYKILEDALKKWEGKPLPPRPVRKPKPKQETHRIPNCLPRRSRQQLES